MTWGFYPKKSYITTLRYFFRLRGVYHKCVTSRRLKGPDTGEKETAGTDFARELKIYQHQVRTRSIITTMVARRWGITKTRWSEVETKLDQAGASDWRNCDWENYSLIFKSSSPDDAGLRGQNMFPIARHFRNGKIHYGIPSAIGVENVDDDEKRKGAWSTENLSKMAMFMLAVS